MNLTNLMQSMGPSLLNIVGQDVLWGIMVLGVYITLKFLDIADLTVNGSFALGGCVCATLTADRRMNPVAALAMATLAGMAAGLVTGILRTVSEMPSILVRILTQISLWFINLWVMEGSSDIPLLKSKAIVTMVSSSVGFNQVQASQVIGITTAIFMAAVIYWFFGMEIGNALRTVGNNEDAIRALGANTKWTELLALVLSNGLAGMSGALVRQGQKYADVQMGIGAVVVGLAAIVIREVLSGWSYNFAPKLSAAIIGSVIYFVIRASVTRMSMNPNYMKLLPAIVVTLALCISVAASKWRTYKEHSEGGNA